MNKILKILTILFFAFSMFGCTNNKPVEPDDGINNNPVEPVDENLKFLENAAADISIPDKVTSNIVLRYYMKKDGKDIDIVWDIDKIDVISDLGRVKRGYHDEVVNLVATFSYQDSSYQKFFTTTVVGYSFEERVELIKNSITINTLIDNDLELPNSFADPDAIITWESTNQDILTNDGKYTKPSKITSFDLILIITIDNRSEEIIFNMKTFDESELSHLHINYAKDYLVKDENLEVVDDYLTLKSSALYGEYESDVYETLPFVSMVGSWSALTSTNATVEILYKVFVDGSWSEYLSYGEWGLGLENKCYSKTTSDGLAKMSTDEIMILNGTSDKYQFKVVLKRNSILDEAPKLLLVAGSFEFENYNYIVSTNSLPKTIIHDVPMLNQNIVPVIGNSICSATSSTMLLKYKGHSFVEFDEEYEHRYIAGLVKDYNHDIFGNWVYNVAVMGSYGDEAYLMRMYSLDELVQHLANVGPVAASVKGNMQGYYNTNGHLIVIKGYEYVNGELLFVCNDPNLKNVEVRYTADTMKNVWRNIVYVIK